MSICEAKEPQWYSAAVSDLSVSDGKEAVGICIFTCKKVWIFIFQNIKS